MATIKGQNLRVLLDGQCVAAATSCTLHVSLETENASTKDDDSDFATVNPVGVAWDVSVDALVTDNCHESGTGVCDSPLVDVTGFSFYSQSPIRLRDGDVLSVRRQVPSEQYKIAILDEEMNVLASAEAGNDASYTATDDITVYVACSGSSAGKELVYTVEDGDSENASSILEQVGGTVTLQFSQVSGLRNREETTRLLQGDAIITDYSLTAGNRQNSTYTVQFTGTGELEFVEE